MQTEIKRCSACFGLSVNLSQFGAHHYHNHCLSCFYCKTDLSRRDFIISTENKVKCLTCSIDVKTTPMEIILAEIKQDSKLLNKSSASLNLGKSETDTQIRLKRRRLRTVFKKSQLDTLKDYFRRNRYPDNNSLSKITLETGLKKRVVQIWFQNERRRNKRVAPTFYRSSSTKTV